MINVILLTAALFPGEYNGPSVTIGMQSFDKKLITQELQQQLSNSLTTMTEQMSINIITTKQNFSLLLAEQNTTKQVQQPAVFDAAE